MYSLLLKLLQQEKDVVGLLECDPWAGDEIGPKYITANSYSVFCSRMYHPKTIPRHIPNEILGFSYHRMFPRIRSIPNAKPRVAFEA